MRVYNMQCNVAPEQEFICDIFWLSFHVQGTPRSRTYALSYPIYLSSEAWSVFALLRLRRIMSAAKGKGG